MPRLPLLWPLRRSLLGHFNLAADIAQDSRFAWSEGKLLFSQFDLEPAERRTALRILRERPNYWLFRTSQRDACADFALVDLSVVDKSARSVLFVELKQGVRWSSPSEGHRQFRSCAQARAELARRFGLVEDEATIVRAMTDEEELIAWLGQRDRWRSPARAPAAELVRRSSP